MDKQRDQESNNPGARDVPFSNSMMEDKHAEGSPNAGANDDRAEVGAWTERSQSYEEGGRTPGKIIEPLPPDPHAPPGPDAGNKDDNEISDYGLNEAVEVGYNPHQSQFGTK